MFYKYSPVRNGLHQYIPAYVGPETRVPVKNSYGKKIMKAPILLVYALVCVQLVVSDTEECYENCIKYKPLSPLVQCDFLAIEFLNCSQPEDLKGNETLRAEQGYGCTKWGGERYEEVQKTKVWCEVLPGIHCYGNRTFLRGGFPCIKYTNHYFVTTLIYSVLLGFLGMDRFCLGHTGTAVGKLLTLGGVGIWWIVDIVLLVTGVLRPEDESNWVPYY